MTIVRRAIGGRQIGGIAVRRSVGPSDGRSVGLTAIEVVLIMGRVGADRGMKLCWSSADLGLTMG